MSVRPVSLGKDKPVIILRGVRPCEQTCTASVYLHMYRQLGGCAALITNGCLPAWKSSCVLNEPKRRTLVCIKAKRWLISDGIHSFLRHQLKVLNNSLSWASFFICLKFLPFFRFVNKPNLFFFLSLLFILLLLPLSVAVDSNVQSVSSS